MSNKIYGVLILILTIVLVGGGIWFLVVGQKDESDKKPEQVTSTSSNKTVEALSEAAVQTKKDLTKTDKKFGDLVLETNSEYEIRYLISNDEFMVLIKKSPYEKVKEKAEKRFTDKGFSAGELCLLKIGFAASKVIRPDFSAQDAVPTGCRAPIPVPVSPKP